ncbi:MAG: hypothetical protein OEM05_04495 [Myxococcales bacterium]|nr:hypothetical protein [Myxococcales bacterium]
MRRQLFLLLLEFLAITLPLTWLWHAWGRDAYLEFFQWAAGPALAGLGVARLPRVMVGNRFLNLLPFVTLMIITPGLSLRRRGIGAGVGLVLIFFIQIGFAAAAYHVRARYGLSARAFSALFPALLFSDSFPFLLWAVIAKDFVTDIGRRTAVKIGPGPPRESR